MSRELAIVGQRLSWIAHYIGNSQRGWEIAVVRSDFEHGFLSMGWEGEKKITLSSVNAPCSRDALRHWATYHQSLFDRMWVAAQDFAADLNAVDIEASVSEPPAALE
jgi:hypothetical protein